MDKQKLIKGGIWLSFTALIIMVDAMMIHIGFYNIDSSNNYTIIIIAFLLLPLIFFCAFRGIKNVLGAIFS